MRIYFIACNTSGCGQYRCSIPAKGLRGLGHKVRVSFEAVPAPCYINAVGNDALRWKPDVVVFQRQFEPSVLAMMRDFQKLGILCVYELDDDLWSLPLNHRMLKENNARLPGINALIQQSDGVTVSTLGVREAVRERFSSGWVSVLPNCVDGDVLHARSSVRRIDSDPEVLRIGWAGGSSHDDDLAMVRDAVLQLVRKRPLLRCCFFGHLPRWVSEFPKNKLLPAQAEHIPMVPFGDYYDHLAAAEFTIGIVPLLPHRFNQSRGCGKWMEYTVAGVPTVASAVGETGNIALGAAHLVRKPRHDHWLRALTEMLDDPELRAQTLASARVRIEARTIQRTAYLWADTYRRFQELRDAA